MLQRTEIVLILEKILAKLAIFNEVRDSIGQQSGMRKVAQCKFGEEKVAIASDLKGSHLLPAYFDNADNGTLMLSFDGFVQFLSKREISSFVVSGAPRVLLAVGADLYGYLYSHHFS